MRGKMAYLLMAPGLALILLFLIMPLLSTLALTIQGDGGVTLVRYTKFFKDPYYLEIYCRTLHLSLIATLICVVLGFPTAYYISKLRQGLKTVYIILAVFPLLTSPVVRSFSWIVVLGKNGIINNLLQRLNVIDAPLSLIYNEFSIVVGFVNLFLPLMIMSLLGVMENIDPSLLEAAASLGASKLKAFIKVVFPLSIPGLIVGSMLVFTGCFTAYTTPQLLGGNKSKVLATLIYQNAMTLYDWNTAAVIAVIMIVTAILINQGLQKLTGRFQGKGEVGNV